MLSNISFFLIYLIYHTYIRIILFAILFFYAKPNIKKFIGIFFYYNFIFIVT